jgi:RNase Y N-terminal region
VLALDQNIWFGIAGLLLGVLFALSIVWVRRKQQRTEIELAENAAARIIEEAKRDAGAIKKEAEIQAESFKRSKSDWSAKKKLWTSGSIRSRNEIVTWAGGKPLSSLEKRASKTNPWSVIAKLMRQESSWNKSRG